MLMRYHIHIIWYAHMLWIADVWVQEIRCLRKNGGNETRWRVYNAHYLATTYHPTHINCTRDDVIKWKHFPRYWPFVQGIRWIPCTKASNAELWCFLWSASEQRVEWTIVRPVIWDATAHIITLLEWSTIYMDVNEPAGDNGANFISVKYVATTNPCSRFGKYITFSTKTQLVVRYQKQTFTYYGMPKRKKFKT